MSSSNGNSAVPGSPSRALLASMSGSYGGMEVRMQQDAEMLLAQGWVPAVSTPAFRERPEWEASLNKSRVSLVHLPYPYLLEHWQSRHLQALKARFLTAPMLSRQRYDLAHVFLSWTTYGLGMLWAISRAGIPAMVSVHNAFPKTAFSNWHQRHLHAAFATTRKVVAVSHSAMDHFLDNFADYLPATASTQVIPNPVDTERFTPKPADKEVARQRLGVPLDACVIGSIGRLDKQKQPWKLIETLSSLLDLGVAARLVLVGQGKLETALKDQARQLGIADKIVFTGHLCDVENVLPAFDLHLLLSRNEGFGIVTAEAMAAGIPAAGSNVPGTHDVLSGLQGGLLLDSDQPRAIAQQLAKLLNAPHRLAEMAAAAPTEIRRRYARQEVEAQMFTAYQDVLIQAYRQC